jgi:hypothetical protein
VEDKKRVASCNLPFGFECPDDGVKSRGILLRLEVLTKLNGNAGIQPGRKAESA